MRTHLEQINEQTEITVVTACTIFGKSISVEHISDQALNDRCYQSIFSNFFEGTISTPNMTAIHSQKIDFLSLARGRGTIIWVASISLLLVSADLTSYTNS